MKKRFRNHLAYNWWLYIISCVLVAVFWVSVFTKLAEPKAHEQIAITYIGGSFQSDRLREELSACLPGLSGQGIRRVSVESVPVEGEYDLNMILRARMSGGCDFLILESDVTERFDIHLASYFAEVDAELLQTFFDGVERIEEEGKTYGILVRNGTRWYDYYAGDGALQIFFAEGSVNLGTLNGGTEEQDAALQMIKYLTEERNVQE